jgi:hypothetical protein
MAASIKRRSVLLGALGGVSVGAAARFAAARLAESATGRKRAASDAADKRSYAEVCEDSILGGFDFERFRPRVFCVETLAGSRPDARIVDLMRSKDYEIRGGTFVNTVFVDRR